eukprot:884997-Pleurochrysis_carterae.AAC.2
MRQLSQGARRHVREWVERMHPRALLLHVERTKGSRQDIAFEGAAPVYLNPSSSWRPLASVRVHAIILLGRDHPAALAGRPLAPARRVQLERTLDGPRRRHAGGALNNYEACYKPYYTSDPFYMKWQLLAIFRAFLGMYT